MDIGLIPKFAAGKALLALDELGLKEFSSELLDAALEAGRVFLPGIGARSYAVPDEFTTLALYYNKEMFLNAGLDPERPPASWSEFVEYAKKLTKDFDGDQPSSTVLQCKLLLGGRCLFVYFEGGIR